MNSGSSRFQVFQQLRYLSKKVHFYEQLIYYAELQTVEENSHRHTTIAPSEEVGGRF